MKSRRSTKVIAARAIRAVTQLAAAIEALGQGLDHAAARDGGPPTRRRLSITPARRRQLKLQGTYIGLVRRMKPKQKAHLRAIREKQGYEAAIRRARRIAG